MNGPFQLLRLITSGALVCVLAVIVSLGLDRQASAQAFTSSTVNGVTVTVSGGSNQSVSAVDGGARVLLDGREILAKRQSVTVDGIAHYVEPYTELAIEAGEWGLTIKADGVVVYRISEIDGLRAAANKGNPVAQNNLGVRLLSGEGVERNPARTVALYRAAAEQGLATAQSNLAYLYWNGDHIEKDPVEAISWAKKAAEQNYGAALFLVARAHETGLGANQDLSAAVAWYRKAVEQDNPAAMNNLAVLLSNGDGIAQDTEAAVRLYRQASDAGYALASQNLGMLYWRGKHVAVDLDEAERLLQKAVTDGGPTAAEKLDALRAERQTAAAEPPAVPLPAAGTATPPPLPAAPTANAATPPPLPAPPVKDIYVAVDGQQRGPLSTDDLKELIRSGSVTGDTPVWKQGMAAWQPIGGHPDYAPLIAAAQPTPPPVPAAPAYYVLVGGQQQGPFTLEQITAMAASGQVSGTTLVWQSGMVEWQPAASHPPLAAAFPPGPPPVPAGPPPVPGGAPQVPVVAPAAAPPVPGNPTPQPAQSVRVRSYCSATGKEGIGSGPTFDIAQQKAIQACVANGGLPDCCPRDVTQVR